MTRRSNLEKIFGLSSEKNLGLSSTSSEAVIAVATRDHSKNGASPKSNTSRRNIRSLVILFLLVCSTLQLSAQKCKFDYDKKDPLTGEVTKGNTFKVKIFWHLGFNKIGNKYFVSMLVYGAGNIREIITPANTLIFKLANGEIITLNANDNFYPIAQATQGGIVTTYSAKYDISEENLQKITASPLVYAKVEVGSLPPTDAEFNVKKGTEFQNKAKCILQ